MHSVRRERHCSGRARRSPANELATALESDEDQLQAHLTGDTNDMKVPANETEVS